MNGESIGCGSGKFYTGFTPMPEHTPNSVPLKERYKQTLEVVPEDTKKVDVQRTAKQYTHFARIDRFTSLEDVEGLLFLTTPDILFGLAMWAFFDNSSPEAIFAPFGPGCGAAITQAVNENRHDGYRAFLVFLDLSTRPYAESNILSFTIPMPRFGKMCETMYICSLDAHAWDKVKARIDEG